MRGQLEQLSGSGRLLNGRPTPQHQQWARQLYTEARRYDFADYQMECDDELTALGLARRGVNPEYPEDGEVVLYE